MAKTRSHKPVMRFAAVSSSLEQAFRWTRQVLSQAWGKIEVASPVMAFEETTFYQLSMGSGLSKQLLGFGPLIDPGELVPSKLQANAWEAELAQTLDTPVGRPVNIDPGYVSEAKVVLATAKDRDHRLYLGDGIFGEVTLYYRQQRWQASRWTYPDYQKLEYHRFFSDCRRLLRQRYRQPTQED